MFEEVLPSHFTVVMIIAIIFSVTAIEIASNTICKNNTERNSDMKIRNYKPSDCKEMAELFYHTVHTVNAKDYTEEQLNVWATGTVDLEKWNQSFLKHYSVVAVEGERIIGFGDIDKTGYLDRLYVHSDYQKQGIATAICDALEVTAHVNITTHASITARSFFEKRGYKVIKEQQVERQNIFLTNFVMEKEMTPDEFKKL